MVLWLRPRLGPCPDPTFIPTQHAIHRALRGKANGTIFSNFLLIQWLQKPAELSDDHNNGGGGASRIGPASIPSGAIESIVAIIAR